MSRSGNPSRSKLSYFLELLIIVSGIMVSFILNEWRETKKIEDKKEHLLSDISTELTSDSLSLERAIKYYDILTRSHDSLLLNYKGTLEKDSLDIFLDHFCSYFTFTETKTSFKRIINDQELTVEKEDTLIQYYMQLHNIVYPALQEWYYIEKDFVLNIVLPYMDKNAPFIYPTPYNKSFSGEVYYELRKNDEFMNYLKSGKLYKMNVNGITKGVLGYVKQIKTRINKHLLEQRKKEAEDA